MWFQYDEDLYANLFFKEIKDNHEDILKKASEEEWIICIPRTESFTFKETNIDAILDHVLVQEVEGKFITMSKKEVLLDHHCLKLENEVDSDSIEVLFEETHYIEESKKYTVWCIEKPLFSGVTHYESKGNVLLQNLHNCVDFLWAEMRGNEVLQNIQQLCTTFWSSAETNFETESLQSQKDLLGILYSQCLHVCLKNELVRTKCNQNVQFLDNLKISVETYMQHCLGKRLIYSVNTLQHVSDSFLNKTIRNSSEVTLEDLNILENLGNLICNAKSELSRFNTLVTVLDKINCLKETFSIFYNINNNVKEPLNMCLTSDDFLQILVYLILKLNIPNWTANLTYLKEFRFSSFDFSNQHSFLVTTLEAAIEFIKSSEFLDIQNNISGRNKNINESTAMLDLKEHNSFDDSKLCHPLCCCSTCEKLLNNPFNVQKSQNILNENDQNLIILSSMDNNVTLLGYLLTLDYDVNFQDIFGKTALHYACQNGFQDIVFLLINAKADVNTPDINKNTPLHLACDRGHENCVKALIYSSSFLEVNLENYLGETALFLATRWGFIDIVTLLLENGVSVCIKSKRNVSVYMLSPNYFVSKIFESYCSEKSNNLAKEIQEKGFLNQTTPKESCSKVPGAGELAVKPKNLLEIKKVDLLLKAIENDDLPLTCFYLGFNNNSPDNTIKLESKCHPLCTCKKCLIDLDSYVENPPKKTDKLNVNVCNIKGWTPLHLAAKYGRTEISRLLLDAGASANIRTYKSLYTPLHIAAFHQKLQTVKELLKCGSCRVDAQDVKGNTALFYACIKNNLKIVEVLCSNGADCVKKNFSGVSILQECDRNKLFRVASTLRSFLNKNNCNQTKDFGIF